MQDAFLMGTLQSILYWKSKILKNNNEIVNNKSYNVNNKSYNVKVYKSNYQSILLRKIH